MTNSESHIAAYDSVAAIRSRPALYIGPLDRPALGTFLLQEACCLAFDFAATGCCDRIAITIRGDGSACVADNGPGLPVSTLKLDRSLAEVLFTELFACRDWKSVQGVGLAACRSGIVAMNALAEFCHIRTTCDGYWWEQQYRRGIPLAPFERSTAANESGTYITFKPDADMLPDPTIDELEFRRWLTTLPIDLSAVSVLIETR